MNMTFMIVMKVVVRKQGLSTFQDLNVLFKMEDGFYFGGADDDVTHWFHTQKLCDSVTFGSISPSTTMFLSNYELVWF